MPIILTIVLRAGNTCILIIIIIINCSYKAQHRLQRPQGPQVNTNMNTKTTRAVLGFRGLWVARLMACGCWV